MMHKPGLIGGKVMKGIARRGFPRAGLLMGLLVSGCYAPQATISADTFSEEDTATYLILTDQLQRVRNVLDAPAKVCLARLENEPYGGLALVPPQVVERLRRDQAALDSTLELIASVECLAHYVRDKGPFTPEESDVLVYSGKLPQYAANRPCGDLRGGFYDPGNLDRSAEYGLSVENGVAKLTGGHCPHQYYVRIG